MKLKKILKIELKALFSILTRLTQRTILTATCAIESYIHIPHDKRSYGLSYLKFIKNFQVDETSISNFRQHWKRKLKSLFEKTMELKAWFRTFTARALTSSSLWKFLPRNKRADAAVRSEELFEISCKLQFSHLISEKPRPKLPLSNGIFIYAHILYGDLPPKTSSSRARIRQTLPRALSISRPLHLCVIPALLCVTANFFLFLYRTRSSLILYTRTSDSSTSILLPSEAPDRMTDYMLPAGICQRCLIIDKIIKLNK